MKRLFAYTLALGVVACSFSAHARTWDPTTGNILTDHLVTITIQDVAVSTPGAVVKVGTAVNTPTGQAFELYDRDGDGEPDLGKNPLTGKFYEIVSIKQEDGPQPEVVLHRNDVSTPILDLPKHTGNDMLNAWGSNALTASGGGTSQHLNVLVFDAVPGDCLDSSYVRVGIRQSSAWTMESFVNHPRVRYELLMAESSDALPWAMVAHVEGSVRDVARWMIANGTIRLSTSTFSFQVITKSKVQVTWSGSVFLLDL